MDPRPATLQGSLRRHWRWYWPAWLFPAVLFGSIFFMPTDGGTNWVFILVDLPFFYFSFFRASTPYQRREERLSHSVILGMLVPFLLWAVLIFGPLVLVRIVGDILR